MRELAKKGASCELGGREKLEREKDCKEKGVWSIFS
jgi:hypothetical protein